MRLINWVNKKQYVMNSQDSKTCQGICSTTGLCAMAGGVMGLTLLMLSWVAVIIACIGIVGIIIGTVAIYKMPYIRGKIGTLLSIFILLACSIFAIIFLINSQQEELQESLFQAAYSGNKNRVKYFVSKGADINKGKLLHLAIRHGNNQMVEALLAGGADANAKNPNGLTVMQLLLNQSINPWLRKKNFDYEAAASALLANGATFDFHRKDDKHRTCIQIAISENQSKMLRLMFKNGADINFKDGDGGYLHYAAKKKAKIDVIETLLSAGIDINIRSKVGNTALHTATYFGRRDIVEALLNRGADINSKNNRGLTALAMAKKLHRDFYGKRGVRKKVIKFLEEKELSSQQGEAKEPDIK